MGCLGIPNHSRSFAKALAKISNLKLIQIESNFEKEGLLGDKDLYKLFGKPDFNDSNLIFWQPPSYANYSVSKNKNIGYYIFEYNIIPPKFVEQINSIDAVCTASRWGNDVLKANGVTVPVHIVPGGVDHSKFNSLNRKPSQTFRFLHVGKAENRKGTELLINAFSKAFCGDENIRLSLYIDNVHIAGFSAEDFVKQLSYSTDFELNNIDVKHWIPDIRQAYNTHHCAVFPTKAEGIGLPIVEAMACGMPVIVSNNTGITEYANDKNCILLNNLKEEPVYDPVFFPRPGEFGTWLAPNEDELIERLRWVYKKYDFCSEIGKNAESFIKENYTWQSAASKLMEVL